MAYEIEMDEEITCGGITYSIWIEAELDFRNEEDPECCGVEINDAQVAPLEGEPLKLGYEGRQIESIVIRNYPDLTKAIDDLLWSEIQTYTEDNYRDLMRDLGEAKYDYDL